MQLKRQVLELVGKCWGIKVGCRNSQHLYCLIILKLEGKIVIYFQPIYICSILLKYYFNFKKMHINRLRELCQISDSLYYKHEWFGFGIFRYFFS